MDQINQIQRKETKKHQCKISLMFMCRLYALFWSQRSQKSHKHITWPWKCTCRQLADIVPKIFFLVDSTLVYYLSKISQNGKSIGSPSRLLNNLYPIKGVKHSKHQIAFFGHWVKENTVYDKLISECGHATRWETCDSNTTKFSWQPKSMDTVKFPFFC